MKEDGNSPIGQLEKAMFGCKFIRADDLVPTGVLVMDWTEGHTRSTNCAPIRLKKPGKITGYELEAEFTADRLTERAGVLGAIIPPGYESGKLNDRAAANLICNLEEPVDKKGKPANGNIWPDFLFSVVGPMPMPLWVAKTYRRNGCRGFMTVAIQYAIRPQDQVR